MCDAGDIVRPPHRLCVMDSLPPSLPHDSCLDKRTNVPRWQIAACNNTRSHERVQQRGLRNQNSEGLIIRHFAIFAKRIQRQLARPRLHVQTVALAGVPGFLGGGRYVTPRGTRFYHRLSGQALPMSASHFMQPPQHLPRVNRRSHTLPFHSSHCRHAASLSAVPVPPENSVLADAAALTMIARIMSAD